MDGPIKQLYEKDGAEYKPIRACDCEGSNNPGNGGNGSGEGGTSLPSSISVMASAYESPVVQAEAKVNSSTGLFTFNFGIPRGKDGRDGKDGKDGDTPVAHRSVMAFKTYIPTTDKPEPDYPSGGYWDIETDIIIYPSGWGDTDNIEKPIWMSTGQFNSVSPKNPIWSKPICISGEDGIDGTDGVNIEFIYKRTLTDLDVPETPPSINITDYVPEHLGWSDRPQGITGDGYQVEWVCTRKKDSNGDWGSWEDPVIWSKWGINGKDGDGIEYIYKINNGEALDNPTPEDTSTDEYQSKGAFEDIEYVPTHLGWTDEPSGVSLLNTHEWVCVRKQKDGVWQPFSNPSLWAKYGTSGTDGVNGISIRTMYAKTTGTDDVPTFVQDNFNPGSNWSMAIPRFKDNEAIWYITAYITYDYKLATVELEDGTTIYGWQGPVLASGVEGKPGTPPNYKTTIFALSTSRPEKPTSDDPKNPGVSINASGEFVTWLDYPNSVPTGEYQWWQCTGLVNGITDMIATDENGDLCWGTVLNVNGKDGDAQDGKMYQMRFRTHSSNVISSPTVLLPDSERTSVSPKDWHLPADMPKTTDEKPFMWEIIALLNPDGTINGQWSDPFCITGEQGPIGETGPAGPIGPIGPAGVSGIPGVSVGIKYCLGTADAYNATYDSTVANDLDPVEYGWLNNVPKVTKDYPYIWSIQTKYVHERVEVDGEESFIKKLESPWCEPFRLTGINGIDGKGVGISSVDEYYLVSELNTGVTIKTAGWVKNKIPPFDNDKIYLWNYEVINYDNETSADPTEPAIIGVQGADGRGIISITEKYAVSDDYINPPATTSSKWKTTTAQAIVTESEPYLWNWEHIVYTSGDPSDFFAVIGAMGPSGTPGGPGQIIYPAGIYNSSAKYICTAQKAPYVYDPNYDNFYVMNYIGTWNGSDNPGVTPGDDYSKNGGQYWMLMEAFDAIYANIGIFGNALVGSAVFNGDYIFSQQGIRANGNNSTSYQNFNRNDPFNPNNSFRPNWCANLRTGEQWFGAGKIHFGYDGSGSLANGTIAWNANGYITKYPKTPVSTITATGDSSYTSVVCKVTTDENYTNIDSAKIEIVDKDENIMGEASIELGANSSITVTITPNSNYTKFTPDAIARLYIDERLVNATNIAFESLYGDSLGKILNIVFNIPTINDYGISLHNSPTREVSAFSAYLTLMQTDGIAIIHWYEKQGVTVNGSTPGSTARAKIGDTIYVYTDPQSASYDVSFVLQDKDLIIKRT